MKLFSGMSQIWSRLVRPAAVLVMAFGGATAVQADPI